jgi:Zn finger protein HypA/HybF involved in hydrogenase expression
MSKFDNIDRKRFPIPSRETVSKCIDLHYEFKRKREMSGCHPENTIGYSQPVDMSLCGHGRIIMMKDCYYCDIEKRLDKLESYMEMEDRVTASDVLFRLERLETCQKEQLNKLAKFSIEINEMRSGCHEILQKASERRNSKVLELEKTINDLVDKIAEIGNYYYQEKQMPYKCPVCDGEGLRFYKEENKRPFSQCEVCEGSCVLWK